MCVSIYAGRYCGEEREHGVGTMRGRDALHWPGGDCYISHLSRIGLMLLFLVPVEQVEARHSHLPAFPKRERTNRERATAL